MNSATRAYAIHTPLFKSYNFRSYGFIHNRNSAVDPGPHKRFLLVGGVLALLLFFVFVVVFVVLLLLLLMLLLLCRTGGYPTSDVCPPFCGAVPGEDRA